MGIGQAQELLNLFRRNGLHENVGKMKELRASLPNGSSLSGSVTTACFADELRE